MRARERPAPAAVRVRQAGAGGSVRARHAQEYASERKAGVCELDAVAGGSMLATDLRLLQCAGERQAPAAVCKRETHEFACERNAGENASSLFLDLIGLGFLRLYFSHHRRDSNPLKCFHLTTTV